MPDDKLTAAQALTLLAATPKRLAALTADREPARLRARANDEEWSANDVLAHLRACADVWGGCIARIVAEETPTLRAINPRAWINRTDYLDLDFAPSLRAFATQRAALLAILGALPREGWSRKATVTGAGAPLERTVLTYAQRLARHERPHVKQIERLINALRT